VIDECRPMYSAMRRRSSKRSLEGSRNLKSRRKRGIDPDQREPTCGGFVLRPPRCALIPPPHRRSRSRVIACCALRMSRGQDDLM
jgi:hypothetical protein